MHLALAKRNEKIKVMLEEFYSKAIDKHIEIDESKYKISLDELFSTNIWGYREVMLVVIVAMKLDDNFKASTGLYDCNPRSIFEGPIKEFFLEKRIPHRQSGPLNIAKATKGLNENWAAQRRPYYVANEVVSLIKYLESAKKNNLEQIDNFGISIMRRFIAVAEEIKSLEVKIEPNSDPEFLFSLCKELIEKTPDIGNTPQRIATLLLKNYHASRKSSVVVTGGTDSASTTSTTSKKPGDANEESIDGHIYKVYEITVKKFDLARIRDSYSCISIYNRKNSADIHEIVVICRNEDCPTDISKSGLHGYLGNYSYQDVQYFYVDIFEWISNLLIQMTSGGRAYFYNDLSNYINDINTSKKVKALWKKMHE